MDSRMDHVEDLSERPDTRKIPTIPRNVTIVIFTVLTLSGILVGAFLPELIEGSIENDEADPLGDIMDTFVASSISNIEISGTIYANIPVPTAYQVLLSEGDPTVDYTLMDAPIGEMMAYLLGEGMKFELTVSPGVGLDGSNYVLGSGSGNPDTSISREVPVGLDDDEGTIVFELRIWGWN